MGKIEISPKRRISITKDITKGKKMPNSNDETLPSIEDFKDIEKVDTRAYILNQENIGEAILDCLMNNDPEGVIEVITIYLRTLNKEKFRQKAEMGKSTYYYLIKSKNPTIKTLAKIVHSLVH